MTALSASVDRLERYMPDRVRGAHYGTNATQFYKGGLVGIDVDTGLLVKMTAAGTNAICVGICEDEVLTANATTYVRYKSGCFKFANGDSIAMTDVGKPAFVADDNTVNKANASDDPQAGYIYAVDSASDPGGAGVWVAIKYPNGPVGAVDVGA
jgi:hypothetical protein